MDSGGRRTIFVEIAAYRDRELLETVKSLIAASSGEYGLSGGVVNQYDEETEHILDGVGFDGLKVKKMAWRESGGVGLARWLTEEMYGGEDFVLQVDSHSRFDEGWDRSLVEQWEACRDERAVLSTYPPIFKHVDGAIEKHKYVPVEIYVEDFYYQNIPRLKSREMGDTGVMERSLYATGGFEFFRGEVIGRVRYNKKIVFMGEEILRSLQFFTYGYNVYVPREVGVYHLYGRGEKAHHFWDDMKDAGGDFKRKYDEMTMQSYELMEDILSGRKPYLLGNERSLEDFEERSGVDFKNKRVVVVGGR
jgi:hypothetical protein